MSREITKDKLKEHKNAAILKLSNYIDSLIDSSEQHSINKADKLCYWLKDWVSFLEFENQFKPLSLKRYKRGEIIKVHLGFNVGSEEGGLHYAVVCEKNNPRSSPVVTVVPLTSIKPNTNLENLKTGNVFLGNELFTSLNAKLSAIINNCSETLNFIESMNSNTADVQSVSDKIASVKKELFFARQVQNEVLKMKRGSIALVGQITTISKLRIYDPKTNQGILSGIKLSNEKLDLIDAEISKMFLK